MDRRDFTKNIALAAGTVGLGALASCEDKTATETENNWVTEFETGYAVSDDLAKRMYAKALEITKSKVRGGDSEPFFKEPFIDAAFSPNIFLWDTCFMVCFCKYHIDELPVHQALDNFYGRMEEDGYICREYRPNGEPLWSKDHPVSINPPLLGWAEWEIFKTTGDTDRLKKVYPILLKNFDFHVNNYQMEDGLFYGDTLGMGMDNIPRSPRDWEPTEGSGLTHHELGDKLAAMNESAETKLDYFIAEYVKTRQGVWNKQSRLVDFSAQMGMFALQLIGIAETIEQTKEVERLQAFHAKLKEDLNALCWSEEDSYYYDLGFGKQVVRRHIGAYWMLLGELVPEDRMEPFLAYLKDPDEYYRLTPLPALSAADPDYVGWGDYWLGGVWAPTSYMVLKGLQSVGQYELAKDLAEKTHYAIAKVFEATDTFWENYAPDLIAYGMPAKKDFCGWTGLIPIAIYREFLGGTV